VCSEEQRRDEGEDAVREKLSQVGTESRRVMCKLFGLRYIPHLCAFKPVMFVS
jgi:hypothetical protein